MFNVNHGRKPQCLKFVLFIGYLVHLLPKKWDIFHAYIRQIAGQLQEYLRIQLCHISSPSGISQAKIRYISAPFPEYLRNISDTFQVYLRHLSGLSQAYLRYI